jgi:hypothetical protein
MKIIVSLASGANNIERDVMRKFYCGILRYYARTTGLPLRGEKKTIDWALGKQYGIDLRLSYDIDPGSCDIAVQFGAAKPRDQEHHVVRQNLAKGATHLIHIETPLLGRRIVQRNQHEYYRIGVDGFLNGSARFHPEDTPLDPDRLDQMQNDLGVQFIGWKNHQHGSVLILTQLIGDASLRGQNHSEWVSDTIKAIRSITDRPIVVRTHPSMSAKARQEFFSGLDSLIMSNPANLTWSDGSQVPLAHDLDQAGICVTYSSGSTIDAVLAGVPCITMDQGNLAYPVSEWDIQNIAAPYTAKNKEIRDWLLRLAYSQWNLEEIAQGRAWQHVIDILQEQNIDLTRS